MRVSLEDKTLEKMLNYIATKPFNEVAKLIQEVQQDVKLIPEKQDAVEPAE